MLVEKGLFRSILKIIIFTAALILFVVKFDALLVILQGFISVLTPVFIGFAIAFILHRPCNFFRRLLAKTKIKKAATPIAVVLAYLVFFAVIAAIISFIVPQILSSFQQFAENFSTYFGHLQDWLNSIIARFDLRLLKSVNIPSLGTLIQQVLGRGADLISSLSAQVFSITTNVISGVVTIFLGFVFSVYMLAGSDRLLGQCRRVVIAYLPEKFSTPLLSVVRLSADTFSGYIAGQITEACILGGLCFLGMCLFQFDYAPLISVLIGCLALIPIVGAYLGAILSVLLLAMVSPMESLWFLIFLVTLQQLEGNIIYPRVVGRSIGLPGIWVLAAVTVGGGVGGFVGLLVAVPLTSVIYTLVQRNVRKRLKNKANSPAQ